MLLYVLCTVGEFVWNEVSVVHLPAPYNRLCDDFFTCLDIWLLMEMLLSRNYLLFLFKSFKMCRIIHDPAAPRSPVDPCLSMWDWKIYIKPLVWYISFNLSILQGFGLIYIFQSCKSKCCGEKFVLTIMFWIIGWCLYIICLTYSEADLSLGDICYYTGYFHHKYGSAHFLDQTYKLFRNLHKQRRNLRLLVIYIDTWK